MSATACETKGCDAQGSQVVVLGQKPLWLCRDCAPEVVALATPRPPRRWWWQQ